MKLARSPTTTILVIFIALFCIISSQIHAVPKTFSLETFITITGDDNKRLPLSGIYDVTFDLLKADKSVVFTKSYLAVVTLGILSVSIEEEDELDSDLFKDHILTARITISGRAFMYQRRREGALALVEPLMPAFITFTECPLRCSSFSSKCG